MSTARLAPPDNTAVRVALWRALHLEVDAPPHVLADDIGLQLVGPDDGWRNRPDMNAVATGRSRAAVVARTRLIEDLVADDVNRGLAQYVILGAGLDTFAQRKPALAAHLEVYEVDQPGPQAWKRQRLAVLGHNHPDWLHYVPVDFEVEGWWDALIAAGFAPGKPTIVAVTGVSMYLTQEAIASMLRQVATLATGSTLAMTFLLPIDLVDAEERPARAIAEQFMQMAGTPFISHFSPAAILDLARSAGFKQVQHVSAADTAARYFAGRSDGLRPSTAEQMLLATT